METDKEKKEFDEILAKENPDLFLKLKEHDIEFGPSSPKPANYISEPVRIFISIFFIDLAIALILSVADQRSHILYIGGRIYLAIPWWLVFLDGFLFIIYGWVVIKRRRGEIDSSRGGGPVIKELKGGAAEALGVVYIILGLFLVGAVIVQMYIAGFFK